MANFKVPELPDNSLGNQFNGKEKVLLQLQTNPLDYLKVQELPDN